MTTQAERRHLDRLADLGCIVCRLERGEWSPAEIHHPRIGRGLSQRAGHFDAIPLCPIHHRTGGMGVAFHGGPRKWVAMHGTEAFLLEKCRALLEVAS